MRTAPDDLLSMAFFVSVVDAGSFTGAARELGVSKSVVSARVARLEEKLGARLLHRTTRRIALTADGVRMYERCSRVVAAADDASESLTGADLEPRGLLRVNAPTTFGERYLTAPIAAFLKTHAGVRLELELTDRNVDLVGGGFDVGIRIAKRLADSSLRVRKIATDRQVVCAAPEYLRRRGIPWRPQDLVHHDILGYSALKGGGDDFLFATPEGPVEVPGAGRLVSDNAMFLRSSALMGLGIVVMPHCFVAEEIASRRLRTVLEEFVEAELFVFAVNVHARSVPAKARFFIDHLVKTFRVAPWAGKSVRD
jgi:DNA-binding transcriptional LysR family regulator